MIIGTNYTTYSTSTPSFKGISPKPSEEYLKRLARQVKGESSNTDAFVPSLDARLREKPSMDEPGSSNEGPWRGYQEWQSQQEKRSQKNKAPSTSESDSLLASVPSESKLNDLAPTSRNFQSKKNPFKTPFLPSKAPEGNELPEKEGFFIHRGSDYQSRSYPKSREGTFFNQSDSSEPESIGRTLHETVAKEHKKILEKQAKESSQAMPPPQSNAPLTSGRKIKSQHHELEPGSSDEEKVIEARIKRQRKDSSANQSS